MSLPSSSASLQKSLQEFLSLEQGIASPSLALAMAGLGCSCKECNQKYPGQAGRVGWESHEGSFGLLWLWKQLVRTGALSKVSSLS